MLPRTFELEDDYVSACLCILVEEGEERSGWEHWGGGGRQQEQSARGMRQYSILIMQRVQDCW